jgi:hypothetical protein
MGSDIILLSVIQSLHRSSCAGLQPAARLHTCTFVAFTFCSRLPFPLTDVVHCGVDELWQLRLNGFVPGSHACVCRRM